MIAPLDSVRQRMLNIQTGEREADRTNSSKHVFSSGWLYQISWHAARISAGPVTPVTARRAKKISPGLSYGRCNPEGVKRLYLSVEKETAQAEFEYYATQDGVDPDLAECYSFAAKVKIERVLDLTSKAVRKQVGISLREIEPDWQGKPHQPSQLQLIGYWVSKAYGKF